jgi:hypothetical protein
MMSVSLVCPAGRVKIKSAKVQPSTIVVSPETVATATSTAAELKLPASKKTPES